ncbi:hypothetical protein SDC9_48895 [bioreactor metagenome]|jgi:hypothetical protein|uniref:Uncharacterized protein n=1 Tax=bioreactor metagenome TaxID=1076179 RepID=A0A644WFW7_9ZZZZ
MYDKNKFNINIKSMKDNKQNIFYQINKGVVSNLL